jgi:hypothetical protein
MPSTKLARVVIETRWLVNHVANPLVRLLLKSPAHRVLSSRLLLITFTGQKTKRVYTIPVGYVKGEMAIYVSPVAMSEKRGGEVSERAQGSSFVSRVGTSPDSRHCLLRRTAGGGNGCSSGLLSGCAAGSSIHESKDGS